MAAFTSTDPVTGETLFAGEAADGAAVAAALAAARAAQPGWSAAGTDARAAVLRRFADLARAAAPRLARLIAAEAGKTLADAAAEAGLLAPKADATLAAAAARVVDDFALPNGTVAGLSHRPLGVLAVLGPFNFPVHLPNGQITPALLAGNAVLFKPSERTPASGAFLADLWREAGLPGGVLTCLQGGRDTAVALTDPTREPAVDGVLFTGGRPAGLALAEAYGPFPERMLALELGGNNPVVAHRVDGGDTAAVARLVLASAFATSGQRCTCARRLIVTASAAAVPAAVAEAAGRLTAGHFLDEPATDLGPLIDAPAAEAVLAAEAAWLEAGATPLVRLRQDAGRPAVLRPGVLDVTGVAPPEGLADREVFGPLLTVRRVEGLDEAIAAANATRYGLAAALFTSEPAAFESFRHAVRAGVVNLNTPTTGASGKLPFGGVGHSGNHRPAGSAAIDFCRDPVASLTGTL
ncbi:aldehyde dehydrogenase family protein [Phycisphaera mikurensis]|uniref:L-glutamate gamma-semialdehyde dehydrogenase n=1 Tax=Phycisphaera mikurensis (strain NBRC 102666 / KCTC 22515 / FYK2301M01) TaxID=1142394 RepID=I0IF79_PHYMF|nr:aldehyde dehydrogenase family protein [Phycisphaera mikurensis]MBB6440687.1 succinylglutamic semialdehyde dehydrogenase [Phycisphaera mikurensis]BAM03917.1 N-succinylglutamate 5-semialdehyde dehydrogenase [Phycisphaera mikurensis NBRC 102666]